MAQDTVTADRFGYWEISLIPPADLSPTATGQIVAVATVDGQEVRESVPFDLVP